MRPETVKAVKKLRAGKSGLTEAELRAFFREVRTLQDEVLLVQPASERPARAPADPTVVAVTKLLKPIEANSGEKAGLLASAAVRKGVPTFRARGIPDAVKKLKGFLTDQQITEMANSIVRELSARNQPEHRIA